MSSSVNKYNVAAGCAVLAILVIVGISLGIFNGIKNSKGLPLDMALRSVDDRYLGCEDRMSAEVEAHYLPLELQNAAFKKAWTMAEKKFTPPSDGLSRAHAIALYAYTNNNPPYYQNFNIAVGANRSVYGTERFPHHSLHFYVSDAIRILKQRQECWMTLRRTDRVFDENVLNQNIRLGRFASSAIIRDMNDDSFGNTSCFEITTCYGALIQNYSKFPYEEEVLIPPYEIFKVVSVKKKISFTDLWCDVVYVLESNGARSDLNCKALNGAVTGPHSSLPGFRTKLDACYMSVYIMLILTCYIQF